jgi:RNA polymerase sigma-70 factor (ECF subfamily)
MPVTMTREALAALTKTHQADLFRYVRYLGAARPDAEDLVQDTLLAAYRGTSPPNPADHRGMAAWLRGIARNLFLRHCRRKRTDRVRADSRILDQAEALWGAEYLHTGDGSDYLDALRRCLEQLPQRDRQALDLRYAANPSRADMAERLGLSEDGVKSLLRRLRQRLGDCVRRRLRRQEAP